MNLELLRERVRVGVLATAGRHRLPASRNPADVVVFPPVRATPSGWRSLTAGPHSVEWG
jgi:hypothetical protein